MKNPFQKDWPHDVGDPLTDPAIDNAPKRAERQFKDNLRALSSEVRDLEQAFNSPARGQPVDWDPAKGPLAPIGSRIQAIKHRLRLMEEDVDKTNEVVSLRLLDLDLQRRVVQSWPRDEVASTLIFLALGLFSTGTALFAYYAYPGLSPKLAPVLLFWGSGVLLLLAGLAQQADWQSLRDHYFRTRMGVTSDATRRGAFSLTWIPVWMAIGAILLAVILVVVGALSR